MSSECPASPAPEAGALVLAARLAASSTKRLRSRSQLAVVAVVVVTYLALLPSLGPGLHTGQRHGPATHTRGRGKMVAVSSRASNEGSRRYHNHGEGPY